MADMVLPDPGDCKMAGYPIKEDVVLFCIIFQKQNIVKMVLVVLAAVMLFIFAGCSPLLERFGIGKEESNPVHQLTELEEISSLEEDLNEPETEVEKMKEPELYIVNVKPGSNLTLRKTAGSKNKKDSDVIDKFPRGCVFEVVSKHEDLQSPDEFTWWEVKDPHTGAVGWVAKEYLDIPGNQPFTGCEFGLETIGLRWDMSLDGIVKVMGPPLREEKGFNDYGGHYHLLYYDGLVLKYYEDVYSYLEYTISSPEYPGPRNIHVGDSFDAVINKYLRQSGNIRNRLGDPDAEPLYYLEEVEKDGMIIGMEGSCYYNKETGKPSDLIYSDYVVESEFNDYVRFEFNDDGVVESITRR